MLPRLLIMDIDGVVGETAADCAATVECVERLQSAGIRVCFFTNDAVNGATDRALELSRADIPVAGHGAVYTARDLTARFLKDRGLTRVRLHGEMSASWRTAFSGIATTSSEDPQAIVVGDLSCSVSRSSLDEIVRDLVSHRDVPFYAMQKNAASNSVGTPGVDAGFWIAGLEYCSDRRAVVLGKPSSYGYLAICRDAGASPQEAIMASDSVSCDLAGAAAAGLRTVFVRRWATLAERTAAVRLQETVDTPTELGRLILGES